MYSAKAHARALGLTGATLAIAARIVTLGSTSVASAQTVVFAGWGGSLQQAQREVYFNSLEKETGIKVTDVAGVSLAKIKAMVEAKNVEWDVVKSIGMWIKPGAAAGYWEELDYKAIDKGEVPAFLAHRTQRHGLVGFLSIPSDPWLPDRIFAHGIAATAKQTRSGDAGPHDGGISALLVGAAPRHAG